jgi:cobalt-zinc-cadmium resistance protein CzcA
LWFRPQQANIQRSKIQALQAEEQLDLARMQFAAERAKALSNAEKYQRLLVYYREQGFDQAATIRRTATLQMEAGEIDFFQYLQSLQRYTQTRLQYFESLRNFNLSVIQLEYLSE